GSRVRVLDPFHDRARRREAPPDGVVLERGGRHQPQGGDASSPRPVVRCAPLVGTLAMNPLSGFAARRCGIARAVFPVALLGAILGTGVAHGADPPFQINGRKPGEEIPAGVPPNGDIGLALVRGATATSDSLTLEV